MQIFVAIWANRNSVFGSIASVLAHESDMMYL